MDSTSPSYGDAQKWTSLTYLASVPDAVLRQALLTCDGVGVKAKVIALDALIGRAILGAARRVSPAFQPGSQPLSAGTR